MGLMDAMIGYKKKDPYEEALVQMDKKDPRPSGPAAPVDLPGRAQG